MTAYIAIAREDGVHVISDAATVNPAGVIDGIMSKLQLFPDHNLALGVTGYLDPVWVEEDMAEATPVDLQGAIAALPGMAYGIAGRNKALGFEPPHVTILAACWHPTGGPALWVCATGLTATRQGWKPGALLRTRAVLDACDDPATILGRPVDLFDPQNFDPATDGLVLMEHCRGIPADNGMWGDNDHYGVGGFAELTTIGPNGITQRKLKTWPEDVVGQRIRPVRARVGAAEAGRRYQDAKR